MIELSIDMYIKHGLQDVIVFEMHRTIQQPDTVQAQFESKKSDIYGYWRILT